MKPNPIIGSSSIQTTANELIKHKRHINIINSSIRATVNELIEYKRHISFGACAFPKSCWYCNYYRGLDIRKVAQDDLNELLFGHCENIGAHVFILNPTNVFRALEYREDTKTATIYVSYEDYSGSSTHNILNWTALQWARILDQHPNKKLDAHTCSGVLDQLSKLKELVI